MIYLNLIICILTTTVAGNGIIGLTKNEVDEMSLVKSVQGVTDPTKSIYLVAAFHQLHCLVSL